MLKFCVEVGGTFTDWLLATEAGIIKSGKVSSTPGDPSIGVLNAIAESKTALNQIDQIMHGSTIATNSVLERKGKRTALITSKGFRDVIFIQRQSKSKLFDLFYHQPEPLVTRDLVFEVDERMGPDGSVWRPLNLDDLGGRVEEAIGNEGLQSVAVCLLHSYINPQHERALGGFLKERFPMLHVSLSCDVLPRFREYERTSTTVIAGYLKPTIDEYISDLESRLAERRFAGQLFIVQANGGTASAAKIRRNAASMVLSGPAAGVSGGIIAGGMSGYENLLTLDMGGTSTDVCLVSDGKAQITTDYKIDRLPLSIPMYDIATVGAGGGSIAFADHGTLRVGPESAGAEPGPACYGRGGAKFTVTDAHVVTGLLRPDTFFGGKIRLSRAAALEAATQLADTLRLEPMALAEGVVRVADATMAQAMRLVSVERGYDPRDYTLVAFGGAGPLHAASLAEELGIGRVLIPENAGIMSAFGLAHAAIRQDYIKTNIMNLDHYHVDDAAALFVSLLDQARAEFADEQIKDFTSAFSLDMRFVGQAYELNIQCDGVSAGFLARDVLISRFKAAHFDRYHHIPNGDGSIEIVNFRLVAERATVTEAKVDSLQESAEMPGISEAFGYVFAHGRKQDCIFYDRRTLPVGFRANGRIVVEDPTSTTSVPPGWSLSVDSARSLLLTYEG